MDAAGWRGKKEIGSESSIEPMPEKMVERLEFRDLCIRINTRWVWGCFYIEIEIWHWTLLRRRIAIQMLDDIILRWITFCTEPCFYSNHIHAVFVCSMQLRSTWNLIAKVYLSWNATQAHSPLQLFSMCVAVVVVIIIAVVVVVAVLVVGTTYLW